MLRHYLRTAVEIDEDKPVLVDKYISGKELEVDAVSDSSNEIPDAIRQGRVNYVINTRDYGSADMNSDGNLIRRCAVENNVTVFTSLDTVRALLDVLEEITMCVSTIDA